MEKKIKKNSKIVLTSEFGDVYVKSDGRQILRPIKALMTLYSKADHLYRVKKDWRIAIEGYRHMNKVASISILAPQKVVVDGIDQPNPYIERDRNRMVLSAIVRKIGIGFSPVGNVTVVDNTLFYNIYSYFIESIQAKMKKTRWDKGQETGETLYPDCAAIGTKDDMPDKKGKWVFFKTIPPLGIWANYEDKAILDCLNEHTQRQRFGERIAQTIVERNIYKNHPAIGISKVQAKPADERGDHVQASVWVYGYRHELAPADIKDVLRQAEEGKETIDVKTELVEDVDLESEADAIKETEKEPEDAEAEEEDDSQSNLFGGGGK
ncbi:MAG: hypothetical protein KKD77_23350 [Gammaproteobacteria bacterium]|nr:hypothetical protein [Gammaproteobacteria bacterium]